jgi:hypothetical protein
MAALRSRVLNPPSKIAGSWGRRNQPALEALDWFPAEA